jgi:hypothetical protein
MSICIKPLQQILNEDKILVFLIPILNERKKLLGEMHTSKNETFHLKFKMKKKKKIHQSPIDTL